MAIDDIDISILQELSENARIPVSVISSRVNLSVPAVSERIKKLEKEGFISKYATILNPGKFNKCLTCFSFITLRYDEDKLQSFMNYVQSQPDIMECHLITGEYEYMLKIVTENSDTLGNILVELRQNTDVLTTSTSISLSTVKNKASISPK